MGTCPAHAGGGGNRRPSRHIGPTHVIEDFIQLLGVHDELGVTNHVVDGICLGSDKDQSAVGDASMGLPSSTTLQPPPSPPQCCCQDLTFSLADFLVSSSIHCRVSRLSSKAVLISAIISSAWTNQGGATLAWRASFPPKRSQGPFPLVRRKRPGCRDDTQTREKPSNGQRTWAEEPPSTTKVAPRCSPGDVPPACCPRRRWP